MSIEILVGLNVQQRYRRTHPWTRFLEWAQRRCSDVAHKSFKSHGARGITCTLTRGEVELLWWRDAAFAMDRPSLDRRDARLGYSFENCRFIEFLTNSMLPHLS